MMVTEIDTDYDAKGDFYENDDNDKLTTKTLTMMTATT